VLDGSEWLASCPNHFTSWERTSLLPPQVPIEQESVVGPRADLDVVVRRTFLQNLN